MAFTANLVATVIAEGERAKRIHKAEPQSIIATAAAAKEAGRNAAATYSITASVAKITPTKYERCANLNIHGQGTVSFEVRPADACKQFSIRLLSNTNSIFHNSGICSDKKLFTQIVNEPREVGIIIVKETKITIRYYDDHDAKLATQWQHCNQTTESDEKANSECQQQILKINGETLSEINPSKPRSFQQSETNIHPKKNRLINGDATDWVSSYWIWVSIDTNHNVIKVGTGYAMVVNELAQLNIAVPWDDENDGQPLPHPDLSNISSVELLDDDTQIKLMSPYKMLSIPIVIDPPPLVLASNQMTLAMIDNNSAVVAASLPLEAQALYASVTGPQVCVSAEDAAAINYSLDTEGCALYETLQSKKSEFGSDAHMVYIRVTLGENQGTSSGVPFVMEIWPKLCYSPVHNHSHAAAIIKVLHGSINVKYFNPLCAVNDVNHELSRSYLEKDLDEGAVTYILPDLFQTHRLKNKRLDTACITIQCYQYASTDRIHYEYFDYVVDPPHCQKKSPIYRQQFRPNSDYQYTRLMEMVRREYRNRPQTSAKV